MRIILATTQGFFGGVQLACLSEGGGRMKARRRLLWGALILLAACAPLTAAERLQRDVFLDVYWTSARVCVNRYPNVRVDRIQMNGDLSMEASADSRFDRLPFTYCYHDAIAQRVAERRQMGLGVPDDIKLKPDVDFD
jgi:hypothetical protein